MYGNTESNQVLCVLGLLLTWLIVHLPDHARTQSTQGGMEPWMNQVEPVYVLRLFDSWMVGEQSI